MPYYVIALSQCLDWSERRNHLGAALGTALAERLFELEWINSSGMPNLAID
jgi:hypothetical protein